MLAPQNLLNLVVIKLVKSAKLILVEAEGGGSLKVGESVVLEWVFVGDVFCMGLVL